MTYVTSPIPVRCETESVGELLESLSTVWVTWLGERVGWPVDLYPVPTGLGLMARVGTHTRAFGTVLEGTHLLACREGSFWELRVCEV